MPLHTPPPGRFGTPGYRVLLELVRLDSAPVRWTPPTPDEIARMEAAIARATRYRQHTLNLPADAPPPITVYIDEAVTEQRSPAQIAADWAFSLAEALYVSSECQLSGYAPPDTGLPGFADLDECTTEVWRLLRIGTITTRDVVDAHRVVQRYAAWAAHSS